MDSEVNYKIIQKNFIWDLLSNIIPNADSCATTFFSYIFMPRKYFNGTMPPITAHALLLHEKTHVLQWQTEGLCFIIQYLFSKELRREYEMSAYKTQILYLEENSYIVNIKEWAKMITSLYSILNFISEEEAEKEITSWLVEKNLPVS